MALSWCRESATATLCISEGPAGVPEGFRRGSSEAGADSPMGQGVL